MKTKTIKQTVSFKCSPAKVYDALMSSRQHAKFTGAPASISNKEGGRFSVFGDYATGKNLELIPGKKIVQTWRADNWPEDAESIVTFEMEETKEGTKLTFTQTGVPASDHESIKQGWIDYYWNPMKEFLEV